MSYCFFVLLSGFFFFRLFLVSFFFRLLFNHALWRFLCVSWAFLGGGGLFHARCLVLF